MKILIADDDARMRQMVGQVVASLADELREARDGSEAVDVCTAWRPDWVLLDLRMKPMDGLRAAAAITARFPQTHVAIVSQYDDAELRAEAARAGACAYVLKENLHQLPGLLGAARPAGSAAAPPPSLAPTSPTAGAGQR